MHGVDGHACIVHDAPHTCPAIRHAWAGPMVAPRPGTGPICVGHPITVPTSTTDSESLVRSSRLLIDYANAPHTSPSKLLLQIEASLSGGTSCHATACAHNKGPLTTASRRPKSAGALSDACTRSQPAPQHVVEVARRFQGKEGAERPATARAGKCRVAGGGAAPEAVVELAQQFEGREGQLRPRTADPSDHWKHTLPLTAVAVAGPDEPVDLAKKLKRKIRKKRTTVGAQAEGAIRKAFAEVGGSNNLQDLPSKRRSASIAAGQRWRQ